MPSFSVPAAVGTAATAAEVAGTAATVGAGVGTAAAGTTAAVGAVGAGAGLSAGTATAAGAAGSIAAGAGAAAEAGGLASTLSTVGMIGAGLSGVTGTIGALTTAGAQKSAAQYQAAVAENNQILAGRNSAAASQRAQANYQSLALKEASELGKITTAQASSGIDINSGSAVGVRESQHMLDQLDALTIASNVQREIYGYNIQGGSFGSQAELERSQAGQATAAGAINATSSILSGATGVANQYLNWQRLAGSSDGKPLFAG